MQLSARALSGHANCSPEWPLLAHRVIRGGAKVWSQLEAKRINKDVGLKPTEGVHPCRQGCGRACPCGVTFDQARDIGICRVHCKRRWKNARLAAVREKFSKICTRQGYPLSAILSSVTAFLAGCARPRTTLAKAIVLILVIKLFGIVGMKVFMFPDSARPVVDAAAMIRVIGPSPP